MLKNATVTAWTYNHFMYLNFLLEHSSYYWFRDLITKALQQLLSLVYCYVISQVDVLFVPDFLNETWHVLSQ